MDEVTDLSTWCLIVIYIRYQSSFDSLQWDFESNLELDYEGASISIGPSDPHSKLMYLIGMDYEGRVGFRFTFVHKSVLVIMQGCIGVSEQGLWIRLID